MKGLRRRSFGTVSSTLVAATIALVAFFAIGGESADGYAATPTIAHNVADTYLGPEVVVSGQARAADGISSVSVTIQDTATSLYVQDTAGTMGAGATALPAWTALVPPPGDPGVSWRVPVTSLADGSYEVTITATSGGGDPAVDGPHTFSVVSSVTPDLELVAYGADWAYYDEGNEPTGAALWHESAFDASAWQVGPAELGFGDGDEATVTQNRNQGDLIITQYFRHEFTVGDLSEYGSIELNVLRDDGVVAYLNGVEIGRDNMAIGPVEYSTLAFSASEEEIYTIALTPNSLPAGTNVLAFEVHQIAPESSDMSFNAQLVAKAAGSVPLESDATEGTYVLTAGDMAQCSFSGDEAVADQMDELFDTDAGIFIGLGDLAYGSGTINEFNQCYDPTIGRHKAVTWPSPGNHEHYTAPNAAGYRQYFGEAAGPLAGPAGGLWYSFEIDDNWVGIALDSDCQGREVLPGAVNGDGCAIGSDQEVWLRQTLESYRDKNILAFFHHPPYTNNHYTDHGYTWPLWRALVEYGVELTLHGHEHHYERYAQLDLQGNRVTNGTREFIIGSGGTYPRYYTRTQEPESDFRGTFPQGSFDFGVLQLWLQPDGYEWRWESINGLASTDSGTSGLTDPLPTSNFYGTVTSTADGGPIEGATVCALDRATFANNCVDTGADGTYSIGPLVQGQYDLTISYNGSAATTTNFTLSPPADLQVNLELRTPVSISGNVVDRNGAYVVGATACATPSAGGSAQCATTDTSGNYSITNVNAGDYQIDFSATGFEDECWQDDLWCEAPTTVTVVSTNIANIDATLEDARSSISGEVVATENTSLKLEGIQVCVDSAVLAQPSCTTTDATGAYLIDRLMTGNYTVTFTDSSGVRETRCYLDDDCSSPTFVGVVQPEHRTNIDGQMPVVVVPTATPTIPPTPTATPAAPTVTPTPSATPVAPSVTPIPSSTVVPTSTPTLAPTSTPEGTPVVDPALGAVSGTVVAAENPAVVLEGIEVCVHSFVLAEPLCSTTNAQGDYLISGLATSNYVVTFGDPAGLRVTQCYLNSDCDSPIPVGVVSPNERTNIDGALPLIEEPTATPVPPTPTPTPEPTTVPSTSTPVPTVNPLLGSMTGQVFSADSPTHALGGIEVCAAPTFAGTTMCANTSVHGIYVISGLSTGNYVVTFTDLDGEYLTRCYLNSDCSDPIPVGVVSPHLRTDINGFLPSADDPIPTAEPTATPVVPTSTPTPVPPTVTTVAPTATPVVGVPTSTSIPTSTATPIPTSTATATPIPASTATPVAPTAVPNDPYSGSISGRATAADSGDALVGIQVCAEGFRLVGPACAFTNASGYYTIGSLPTSNYTVQFVDPVGGYVTSCYIADDCSSPTPVGVVSPGGRTNINAAMRPGLGLGPTPTPSAIPVSTPAPLPTVSAGGAIAGRISTLTSDLAVFGAEVCAERVFPTGRWCTFSQADGNYLLSGLPSGNYHVDVADRLHRYMPSCWGASTCDNADVLGVVSGRTNSGVDVRLDALYSAGIPTPAPAPQGSIAGTVSLTGDPASGVRVCARPFIGSNEYCATSDAAGNYVIVGLRTGNYLVEFDGGTVCYMDKSSCSSATPVGVVSPHGRTGIDAELGL